MSEPLARARRVVAVGAASLAIVLVALAAAAWRLVEAEEASAAVRGRSAAALAAEDFRRALVADADPRSNATAVLTESGEMTSPTPPQPFDAMPAPTDREGSFYVGESARFDGALGRAALRRALTSDDPVTRVAAAAAGVRRELAEGTGRAEEWARVPRWPRELAGTRDAVLVRMVAPPRKFSAVAMPRDCDRVVSVIGSPDEVDALAMIAQLGPEALDRARDRRRRLAVARTVADGFRSAEAVDASSRVAVTSSGGAVAGVRVQDFWYVASIGPERVREVVRRVLDPRGVRLIEGAVDPAETTAVLLQGDGAWHVTASFSADETRSRSTLLLAGLGVAATAAVAAFAVFARSVRREARLAALRTDFVATVSHELRTPVAVVRTSAETLASGRATRDEDKQALTEAIVRESERLSSLVGNVLDFSRMESGRRTYALLPTDLGALVRDVAARHAGVDVEVADDVPSIACDADALGGAIGNLLDNARKYSAPDAPVTVRVARRGGDVVIEVEDHGIGVPDAEKSHVFERFFRGADARVRETRGAGIGLALVDHAARAHGGRVEVADTAGGGATFRIVLPRAQNG